MWRKLLILHILIIIIALNGAGQSDQGYIDVKGNVKFDRRPIENAKIEIYENGLQIKQYASNINGRFDFQLDLNKSFIIAITKGGMVTKRIKFDTHVPENEIGIWTYKFTVEIFPMVDGLDITVLKKPIAIIKFDDDWGEFDYDEAYTNSILKDIDRLLKEYEGLKLKAYDKTIVEADIAYENKEYDKAWELYDRAIDFNPYEEYPDDMKFQIDRILAKQDANEKNYKKAIERADNNFNDENWDGAITFYERALSYKEDPYPKQKLQEIEGILNQLTAGDDELKRIEEEFRKAMFAGDDYRKQKNYYEARDSYKKALTFKPQEQLPKDNIAELDILIAQLEKENADSEAKQKSYNDAIAAADQSFNTKEYDNARMNYQKALSFLPYEEYPQQRIKEIENILKNLDAVNADYNRLVAIADGFFNEKSYSKSKERYQEALGIKPNEIYPKQKIDEINQLIALQQGKEAAYNQAIASADQFYDTKQYANAKSEYQNALNLKPNETYPQRQLQKVNQILAENATIDQNYNNTIAQADQFYSIKNYDSAIDSYESALKIKPDESYPQQKIAEIRNLLANLKVNQNNYDNLISSADKYFNSESWNEAKLNYEQALQIFPNEQYPKNKIIEIENKLLALKSAKEQKQAQEANYNLAIQQGDQFYTSKQYIDSKVEYEKALAIKPKEKYPKSRIDEILKILNEINLQNQEYDRLIAEADAKFNGLKYYDAKELYQKSLEIKSSEMYPQNKINEIDQLLAQRENERKAKEELETNYVNFIAAADGYFKGKSYDLAKENYQNALNLKSTEIYPRQRINEIDNILTQIQDVETRYTNQIKNADIQFQNKNYEAAKMGYENALNIKPKETYPTSKIAEIDQLLGQIAAKEKQYNDLISNADKSFGKEEWEQAKLIYQQASVVFPNEAYPKNKIVEIDNKLMTLKQAEEERLAQEQINAQYDNLISQADNYFKQESYDIAKENYQNALNLKSTESYPRQRINEIDNILAQIQDVETRYANQISNADIQFQNKNYDAAKIGYENALSIKPKEAYPGSKISEIDQILADIAVKEKEYDKLVANADKMFDKQEWNEAKITYQQALAILPNEVYPRNRIAEIDNQLLALKSAEEARLAKEQAYNAAIANGDRLFASKDYTNAKIEFEKAQNLKPEEKYPKNKVGEINIILADLRQKDEQYNLYIVQADRDFNAKNYDAAITSYTEASNIKPNEAYPKTKINEINTLLAQIRSENQQYQQLIASADNYFNSKNYELAKSNYENALNVKPNESHPQNRLREINTILDNQRKQEQELLAKKAEYDKVIASADKSYNLKDYENAIKQYNSAKQILPDESYPSNQINLINGIIAKQKEELDRNYTAAIREGDQLYGNLNYEGAKAAFERAMFFKPEEDYPQRKLKDIAIKLEQQKQEEKDRLEKEERYAELVKKADDFFNSGDFVSAKSNYQLALNYKSSARYPQEQITKCDKLIASQKQAALAAAEAERQKQLEASKSSFENKDFDYSGEERSGAFLSQMAKEYPEGITVENYDKKNKKIKRVIVNRNGIAKEYIEVKYSYGTYYFRNGQNISRYIFSSETKE